MTANIYGTTELAGMEFDLQGEFEYEYEDTSFDHEFGTERCGHFIVTEILWADFDCDECEVCANYLRDERYDGRQLSRKRARKVLRQYVRRAHHALANADLENVFDNDRMHEIANEQGN